MDVTLENAPQGAAEGATRAAKGRKPISQAKGQRVTAAQGGAFFAPRRAQTAVLAESEPPKGLWLFLFAAKKQKKAGRMRTRRTQKG